MQPVSRQRLPATSCNHLPVTGGHQLVTDQSLSLHERNLNNLFLSDCQQQLTIGWKNTHFTLATGGYQRSLINDVAGA